MFEIVYYEKKDGTKPADEYIQSQSEKMRRRLSDLVKRLGREGNRMRMPHSEYLGDGMFQLRAQQEGNISRVLYFFFDGQKVVLTNGFTKKTPKTPPAEIELAKKYRADYKRREEQNEKDADNERRSGSKKGEP